VIGAAIMVAKIATGEVEDNPTAPDKAHHSAGGKKGGASRAAKLTNEERAAIAKKAAAARWSTLKVTPAMAAGVSQTLWTMEDIAERIEARRPKPGKRRPYKMRVSATKTAG
jgi:hypothetical protein